MKKRCKYVLPVVFVFLISAFGMNVSADSGIQLYVNNKSVSANVKIIDGKPYIPLDVIGKQFNITTYWDQMNNIISMDGLELSVPSIVNKVSPSVVGIIGKLKQSSSQFNPNEDNIVFGTGVIYKENGYIITNAHVVKDMENIVVVLSNSKSYKARLKAIDEGFDLAMIKIDKGRLTPAVFGDISSVIVGEPVIAIGTPLSFSLRNSATKGIISGMNRSADGDYRFIQSDTAINGGNSGGPLVNTRGEVIGINSVKFAGFGVEGLSFSIPVDTVKYVVSQFEKYGKVRRPHLGVVFSEGVAAKYGLPSNNEGLTITEVEAGSPAKKVGLKIDDIIKKIDETTLTTVVDYNEEMKKYLPGDSVELLIDRNGETMKVKVLFDEKK